MIVVVEGPTNSGKTTLTYGLEAVWRGNGKRVLRLSSLFDDDPAHRVLGSLTNPVDQAIEIDLRTSGVLYIAHLCRKVDILRANLNKGGIDHFIVDRMEPSVIAYAAVSGLRVESINSVLQDIVCGLPQRRAIFLEIELGTMLARSESSPLSRKDVLIKENWDTYSSCFRRSMYEFYPSVHCIRADNLDANEMLGEALDVLGID